MHPIEKFWETAYADFQVNPGIFVVPQMNDPILSPRFGVQDGPHLNLIKNIDHSQTAIPGYNLRNNFYLCVLNTKEVSVDEENFLVTDLARAKNDPTFWQLLENGFAKDYQFLHGLMDFLPSLNAQFKVGYLLENNVPYGCVVVGHTRSEAVLLSGMIKDTHRDQKKSRELHSLVNHIAMKENINEYFFWTMSDRLTRYVDRVDRYLIYIKQ
jgi:hypothetical protein